MQYQSSEVHQKYFDVADKSFINFHLMIDEINLGTF